MTDEDLIALISGPETDRVQKEESISDPDGIREAICGFANDLSASGFPGVIAIGVTDAGVPNGFAVTDRLQLQLAQMRDDGKITPFPSMVVRTIVINSVEVLVGIVEPSDSPPVRCDGRPWVRVGPRRAIATPEEERRLIERRRSANLPFDTRPLASATIEDLGIERFRLEVLPQLVAQDVIAANERSTEQQLGALHLIDREGVPTAAGILITGVDPQATLPGSYLQFLKIDGTQLGDRVISEHRLTGVVPQIMREIDEIVRLNIETRVEFAGPETEQRRSTVPFEAVQQIVRNALIHRNYESSNAPVRVLWFSDRVEISSPGGPFGQVSIDNFGTGPTDYRNPLLAGILGQIGFVQRFGFGIATARNSLQRNGNPPIELEPTSTHVVVKMRFVP